MSLIERINLGIKEAIRGKDQVRLNTLRMLKSKILAVDARAALPDSDVLKLFKTYYGSLQEACEQSVSRPDLVEQLTREMEIVREFLPRVPSQSETEEVVRRAISDSGAKTRRDLGVVMKAVMQINSAVDGKLARDLAERFLGSE